MSSFSVADAKNNLSDLIDRALRGEGVIITRHGTPVVELKAVSATPRKMTDADIEWVRARRIKSSKRKETPSESLAALRDEDRF